MKSNQPLLVVVATLAFGAGIFAVIKFSAAREAHAAHATLHAQATALAERIVATETRQQALGKRVQAVEADNALLGEALARAQQEKQERVVASAPVTREVYDARFRAAQQLVFRHEDPATALRELLWCWDEGGPRLGGSLATSRASSVVFLLGRLAEEYSEAKALLQTRCEALRQRVLAGPGGVDAVPGFATVANALKDSQALLEVCDRVPAGDRRRATLAIYAFEPLWQARRYADIMAGYSFATMSSNFELGRAEAASGKMPDPRGQQQSRFVERTVKNIEVLAGSGDLANARDLAQRLLEYDRSESTRLLVQKHVERAGRAGLLEEKGK